MYDKILIAEDDSDLNATIQEFLSGHGYRCASFTDPRKALISLKQEEYDVLLADLKMPHIDGIHLASQALEVSPDIRVLILTAYSSMHTVVEAIRLGVDNYILKPFSPRELLFQVQRSLERRRLVVENQKYQRGLEQLVEDHTRELLHRQRELRISQMESIFAIGNIIEARDYYTRGHTERVTLYAVAVAQALKWERRKIYDLGIGSPLHDIGKIGVPDRILKKEGPLTFEEHERMKEHTEIGYNMVRGLDFAPGTIACILYHHERYDGKGYPFGLDGDDIPEEGRIMAICDAFDAMTSNRVYRKAMSSHRALEIVEENIGLQFDPTFARVFINLFKTQKIRNYLNETDITKEFNEFVVQLIEMSA